MVLLSVRQARRFCWAARVECRDPVSSGEVNSSSPTWV